MGRDHLGFNASPNMTSAAPALRAGLSPSMSAAGGARRDGTGPHSISHTQSGTSAREDSKRVRAEPGAVQPVSWPLEAASDEVGDRAGQPRDWSKGPAKYRPEKN